MSGAVKGTSVLIAALMLCALGWAAPAAAAAASPYEDLIAAINAEKFDEARAIAVATAKTDAARAANLAYVEALVLKRQGRYPEAVAAFRALLAQNPKFDRVRSELAHTLYLMGDDEAASYQFGILAAATPLAQQRDLYNGYISAIDSRRPFTWSGYVSLAPNSNLNGGTDDGTVMVGGVPFTTKKRESGVGVAYGYSGAYRFDLGETRTFTVGAGVNGSTYKNHDYDATTFQGFAEYARQIAGWRMGVGLGGEWRLAGWESARWGLGPQVSLSRDFGRIGSLTASGSWRFYRYDTDTQFDGSELTLRLRHAYAVSAATTLAFSGTFTRRMTEMPLHDYNAFRPGIEIAHEFPNGLIADASVGYEMRRHDAPYFLLTVPREDNILTASMGLTFQKFAWHGFAPRLEYSFERYESNSERGTTTSHGVGVTLTKRY